MQTAAASGHRRIAFPIFRRWRPSDPTGPRFLVEDIYPCVDGGRYPVKRIAGEPIEVWADLLREGHDRLAAELLWRKETESDWRREPMRLHSNDRWHGRFTPPEPGRYLFAIEAWTDPVRHLAARADCSSARPGSTSRLEAREGRELLGELKARDAGIKRLIEPRPARNSTATPNVEAAACRTSWRRRSPPATCAAT